MPISPTYPGVYIQELPSGVRTITGVATSITAFIGRAARGDVNKATTINSFGDYERLFGGLWVDSAMSFAVRDFYLNGGSRAIIVRLASSAATASRLSDTAGAVKLDAATVGSWGDRLTFTIDKYKSPAEDAIATTAAAAISTPATPVLKTDLFHLTVTDGGSGASETFRNLTTVESVRRVDKVLLANSRLVRWAVPALPVATPAWVVPLKDDTTKLTKGNDGAAIADATEFQPANAQANKVGLYALEQADLFNLLVIAPYTAAGDVETTLIDDAEKYCLDRRAMFLIDSPTSWSSKANAITNLPSLGNASTNSKNSAVFFPRQKQPNPFHDNLVESFGVTGAIAGVFARTDSQRGVWKAPAGLDASVAGANELSVALTDAENGELNPLGINCLRTMPASGRVVWGSRTLQGDDRLASEWKYIPVRRTALYIEESVYRGTQWVVFEPNDEPLWSQIRLNLGAFMQGLFVQGAFQGRTPKEAYFVKCDKETTTQDDINRGVVNIIIGFAPLKPAEFVIISLQQMAGQVAA